MSSLTLKANGITLAYDEFGGKENPAIVLIMGLGTQMIAWPEEFCLDLAAKGYRVIRFDNRDVGLSQKFDSHKPKNIALSVLASRLGIRIRTAYVLSDMAKDAIGVLDALDIQQAHVVGASMGGMIAQLMAADHPQRVLSLTSIMSTSGDKSLPGPAHHVLKQMANRGGSSVDEYLASRISLWQVVGSPAYKPSDEALRQRILRSYERSYYPPGYFRQLNAIVASGSRVKKLQTITQPSLVIHGKQDVLVPVAGGIDTARHIKGARLELFEGMGHDLPQPLLANFAELIHQNAIAGGS
jgi:pimeloyl-ACP methyl ester carboxylesterase